LAESIIIKIQPMQPIKNLVKESFFSVEACRPRGIIFFRPVVGRYTQLELEQG
jgi:hypothetical protein